MKNEIKEIVKEENTYKAPVGKKFKKVIKTLGALGLAALLAVGGTFLTSCKDNTPTNPINPNPSTPVQPVDPKPVDPKPVDPKPEDPAQKLLETSTAEYNKILANIVKANSLTTSIETTNGDGAIIFEIQDNKLKSTQNKEITFVETTSTQTFEYSLQENEWHKNLAADVQTSKTIKNSLCQTLEGVKWSAAKQEDGKITLTGLSTSSPSKTSVSCQYNLKDNSLNLTTQSQIMSVYHVNNTLVELPAQFVDDTQDPVKEEFKITAENIEAVKQAMRPHVENICHRATRKSELQDVFSVYLTKSENSSVVDTIGAVYTFNRTDLKGTSLKWTELTIPTNEDITFEMIYNQKLNYDLNSTSYKTLYTFSPADEEKSPTVVNILKSQTLGEDYKKADWTGWYGNSQLGQDPHTLVMLKDNVIYEYNIKINRSNSTLTTLEVVKENFLGKEPSKDTYSQVLKTYNVYEGEKEFLAVETTEKEQNI